jgi:hypothetical protein
LYVLLQATKDSYKSISKIGEDILMIRNYLFNSAASAIALCASFTGAQAQTNTPTDALASSAASGDAAQAGQDSGQLTDIVVTALLQKS